MKPINFSKGECGGSVVALDYGARGWGFKTYLCSVLSLSKTIYSLKVLVIPRKQWLPPDMTEKLLTVTLN